MSFRFKKLEIWRSARQFINKIYKVTKKFPKDESFGLVAQVRRAATSIALNIAEGSDRKSDAEFIRFLRMALTSLEEVVTVLYIALDQQMIQQDDFNDFYHDANQLAASINALINHLRK